jgi:hypothetical protein
MVDESCSFSFLFFWSSILLLRYALSLNWTSGVLVLVSILSTAVSFLVHASQPPHSTLFCSLLRIICTIILQITNNEIEFIKKKIIQFAIRVIYIPL